MKAQISEAIFNSHRACVVGLINGKELIAAIAFSEAPRDAIRPPIIRIAVDAKKDCAVHKMTHDDNIGHA